MAALYVAPRNIQLLCHFPLGKGLSAVETVAQGEDGLLPFWEEFDEAIHLLALQAQVHIVQNVDVVGEHVAPCDAVAVLVSVDGVAEIEVMGRLLPAAKMHEDLIRYTRLTDFLHCQGSSHFHRRSCRDRAAQVNHNLPRHRS